MKKPRLRFGESVALQTRIARLDYSRIKVIAARRGLSVSGWLWEQVQFGLEFDESDFVAGGAP